MIVDRLRGFGSAHEIRRRAEAIAESQPNFGEAYGIDSRLLLEPEFAWINREISWSRCATAPALCKTTGERITLRRICESEGEIIEIRREAPVEMSSHGVAGTPCLVQNVHAFGRVGVHRAAPQVGQ